MTICPLCKNIIYCKGLCELHYGRYKRWGDPYYNNNDWLKNNRRICSIDNCNNIHQSLGLCKSHYDKQRHKNNPEYDKKRSKIYRKNNLNKCKETQRKYYRNNLKKYKDNNKKWRMNNPEKLLENSKRYLKKLGKLFDMSSNEYRYTLQNWSKTIRKLDNNMCKNCDSIKNLNAHHIMPKNKFPELSLDLDNGVILCKKCHEQTHGFEIY